MHGYILTYSRLRLTQPLIAVGSQQRRFHFRVRGTVVCGLEFIVAQGNDESCIPLTQERKGYYSAQLCSMNDVKGTSPLKKKQAKRFIQHVKEIKINT